MEKSTALQTTRILNFIASQNGVTFTQIQKELWSYTHCEPYTRKNRGWWCDQLFGNEFHQGLLPTFCEKRNGKYYRNNVQHGEHPWTCVKKWMPPRDAKVSNKCVCPHCGK